MAIIEWSDSLSVGIGKIDEQHNRLIEMMGELEEAIGKNQAADMVEDILINMFNYARVHFSTEEELFKQHKYPELEMHKLEHQRFMAKLYAFKEKFDNNRTGLSQELLNFLSSWILNHIELTDKRYTTYLNKCGVS